MGEMGYAIKEDWDAGLTAFSVYRSVADDGERSKSYYKVEVIVFSAHVGERKEGARVEVVHYMKGDFSRKFAKRGYAIEENMDDWLNGHILHIAIFERPARSLTMIPVVLEVEVVRIDE